MQELKKDRKNMKQLLFIYNPHAGRQRAKLNLARIVEVFAAQDYEVTVHPTQGPKDAMMAAAESSRYDRVVCSGGDGTLNETVTGLMQIAPEERPVLGYIPTGTTNDFAKNINLPREISKMAEIAGGGIPKACDLGVTDGRYFTYVAAFGLFSDVSYSTPQKAKNLLGHFAYVLEGAGKLRNIPSFHVKIETSDGTVLEDVFSYGMVSNTMYVGGLVNLSKSGVKLDDGEFEVILVRRPRSPKEWQDILSSLRTQNMMGDGAVIGLSARQITFTSEEPIAWTLDGEFGGERNVTMIENLPRAFVLAFGEEQKKA